MSKLERTRLAILETGVIGIVRLKAETQVLPVVEAMLAGGVRAIEITLTVPNALQHLQTIRARFGDQILLGAGTVLDTEALDQVLDAGATFAVSPIYVPELIERARQREAVMVPGCFTPTEIYNAQRAGAAFIKVFPAAVLTPRFFKDVSAPLPGLPLVPTGCVTLENLESWLEAGAVAVGVGSGLIDAAALANHDYAQITARARLFVERVQAFRAR